MCTASITDNGSETAEKVNSAINNAQRIKLSYANVIVFYGSSTIEVRHCRLTQPVQRNPENICIDHVEPETRDPGLHFTYNSIRVSAVVCEGQKR